MEFYFIIFLTALLVKFKKEKEKRNSLQEKKEIVL